MNTDDLQEMFSGNPNVTLNLEVVQDWLLDEFGEIETLIVKNVDTGELLQATRHSEEAQNRMAKLEKLHMEARLALDEAEIPRTAEGIQWLAAVAEEQRN